MDRNDMLSTAEQLVGTMDSLSALLNDEVSRLYAAHVGEMEEICQQKNELLMAYANGVNALKIGSEGQKLDLPPVLSSTLKEKSSVLNDSMQKNMRALTVAKDASEGVVNMIIEAIKKQRTTGAAYGMDRDGSLTGAPETDSMTQAITLDTRL